MGFQNGKFFELLQKLGIVVPVCFGTRLGVSLAALKGVSNWMDFKMASSLNLKKNGVLLPVCFGPRLGSSNLHVHRLWRFKILSGLHTIA